MATRLPELIEPLRLAEKGVRLNGKMELSRMPRLGASLCDQTGQVFIDILFTRGDDRVPYAKGAVKTRLKVLCQRCIEPMDLDIETEMKVELLVGEKAVGRLEDYEPLAVTPESMSLVEFIEDEIILALPIAPMHPEGQCPSDGQFEYAATGRLTNPFAVLSKLKIVNDH